MVSYATFKSVIVITGTIAGCYLLFRYFKFLDDNFIKNGIIVGLFWYAINLALDALILVPMLKSTFAAYFMSIGFGDVAIPVINITIGYILNQKFKPVTEL